MVSRNLHQACLLEVGLTKIEMLFIFFCHVGLHVDFSSLKSSLGLQAFLYACEVNLDGLALSTNESSYIAMVMGLQSCVCEVALIPTYVCIMSFYIII